MRLSEKARNLFLKKKHITSSKSHCRNYCFQRTCNTCLPFYLYKKDNFSFALVYGLIYTHAVKEFRDKETIYSKSTHTFSFSFKKWKRQTNRFLWELSWENTPVRHDTVNKKGSLGKMKIVFLDAAVKRCKSPFQMGASEFVTHGVIYMYRPLHCCVIIFGNDMYIFLQRVLIRWRRKRRLVSGSRR